MDVKKLIEALLFFSFFTFLPLLTGCAHVNDQHQPYEPSLEEKARLEEEKMQQPYWQKQREWEREQAAKRMRSIE